MPTVTELAMDKLLEAATTLQDYKQGGARGGTTLLELETALETAISEFAGLSDESCPKVADALVAQLVSLPSA